MIRTKKSVFLLVIVNILLIFLVIAPILYVVSLSFFSNKEYFVYPPRFLPSSLNLDNFRLVLKIVPFMRFMGNSVLVSTLVMFGQIITATLAGYSFASFEFKGKRFLFILTLSTMMIPSTAIIVANFLTVSSWGLTDSYLGLLIPFLASGLCVFNMRQAFKQLPLEIKEAAILDGCSNFKYLLKIGVPLVRPTLGAIGIYAFLQNWNLYLWPLLVTNSVEMRTVQIGLGMLVDVEMFAFGFGPIMAGAALVLVPSLLLFFIGQKQLISGLTSGAVKG